MTVKSVSDFAVQLLPVVLAWLLANAVPLAWAFVKAQIAKIKDAQLQAVVAKAEGFAETIVRQKMQESVDDLKADAAAGKITPDQLTAELAKQKREAVDQLKNLMTLGGLEKLAGLLGVTPSMAEGFLGSLVEAAVHKIKGS